MVVNNESLLEIIGISKAFPGVQALSNVTFSVRRGETHGLVGENGAGKSTLVKILAGVIHADKGRIIVNGTELRAMTPHSVKVSGIATVYQEQHLIPNLTITENIFLGEELRTRTGLVDFKAMRTETSKLLNNYGLERNPDERIAECEIGDCQQVAIISVTRQNAKFLLFDEPTAALNASEIEHLKLLIRVLQSRGIGILYIAHDIDEVLDVAQRITVLRDGKYVGTVVARDSNKDEVVTMMAGHPVSGALSHRAESSGNMLLTAENLLGGISFALREGEILGIAGTVGSGARDILRMIAGLSPLGLGELQFCGHAYRPRGIQDAIRKGIHLIPEDMRALGLVECLSVAKNISLSGLRRLVTHGLLNLKAEAANAEELVKALGIATPSVATEVRKLSGGNQRKVLLAKAMHAQAKLLLLEDPTQGVDVAAREEIHKLLLNLRRNGTSIVLVSTDLDEMIAMSDQIVVLYKGVLARKFEGQQTNRKDLLSAMLGNEEEAERCR